MSKAALYQSRYIEHVGLGIEDVEAACAEADLPRTTIEVRNRTIVHTIGGRLPKKRERPVRKLPKKSKRLVRRLVRKLKLRRFTDAGVAKTRA